MFAFPAAKRTIVLIMGIALLVASLTAFAGDEKGYLGVVLQDISPSMAKALQIDEKSGVMVNEVVDDSPAAKAGLEDPNDLDGLTVIGATGPIDFLTRLLDKDESRDEVLYGAQAYDCAISMALGSSSISATA